MQAEDIKDTQNPAEGAAENAEAPAEEKVNAGEAAAGNAENAQPEEAKPEEPRKDEKDAKIEELQNRLMRLQADFENFRRRNAAEREQLSTFVTADVVGKFLKVLDNFERAEQSVKTTNDMSAIVAGMEKIKRQFEQAFKELEVEEIPAEGQKFNPELHEAVMRGQNPDLEDESIEQVFEKGYRLRNKIIRRKLFPHLQNIKYRNRQILPQPLTLHTLQRQSERFISDHCIQVLITFIPVKRSHCLLHLPVKQCLFLFIADDFQIQTGSFGQLGFKEDKIICAPQKIGRKQPVCLHTVCFHFLPVTV